MALTPNMQRKQTEILSTEDAERAWAFARRFQDEGADVSALQRVVMDEADVLLCLSFSLDVRAADVSALAQAVTDRGRGLGFFLWTRKFPRLDRAPFERAIIERGLAEDAVSFAAANPDSDRGALEQVVIERGCDLSLVRFAVEVPGADVSKIEEALRDYYRRHPEVMGDETVAESLLKAAMIGIQGRGQQRKETAMPDAEAPTYSSRSSTPE